MKRPGTVTYPKLVGPWDLEPFYSIHVSAMTSEGLHEKADIAFQLALRDKEIASLRDQLGKVVYADQPAATLDTSLMTKEGRRIWNAAPLADQPAAAETAPQGATRRILGGKGGQTVGLEPHWRGCPCSECDETRFGSEDKNPGEVVK